MPDEFFIGVVEREPCDVLPSLIAAVVDGVAVSVYGEISAFVGFPLVEHPADDSSPVREIPGSHAVENGEHQLLL